MKNNDVPVYNFIGEYNLNSTSAIGECLDDLIFSIEQGYFLTWEAVVRDEQGLPLSQKQEEVLDRLLNFSDYDGPILYIDEIPRPSEPWYEIVREIAPKLLIEPFKTFEIHEEIYHEGWPQLADCIEEYCDDLSQPEGVASSIEVVPPNIRHKLELQYCFAQLSGLGQENELTLENEEQKSWRIEDFIDSLKKVRESVDFFELILAALLKLVILPPKDERILIDSLLHELGMKSVSEKLAGVL